MTFLAAFGPARRDNMAAPSVMRRVPPARWYCAIQERRTLLRTGPQPVTEAGQVVVPCDVIGLAGGHLQGGDRLRCQLHSVPREAVGKRAAGKCWPPVAPFNSVDSPET